MRKLKLESLAVESFETASVAPQARGTVQAHGRTGPIALPTYNVQACGETQYFDCSFGCSYNTVCHETCGVSDVDCV